MVADGGDDTSLHSRIVLVHPHEGTDHPVKLTVVAEVVGVVETDNQHRLFLDEFFCDGGAGEPLEGGDAGERRLVSEELFKDGGKDTKGVPTLSQLTKTGTTGGEGGHPPVR